MGAFDNYECDGQLSLFDLITPDYPDFHTMTETEVVQYIGKVTGLKFVHNSYLGQWEAKKGKGKFTLELDRYTTSWKDDSAEGDLFISFGYQESKYGWGHPCDSIEDVVKRFRKTMKEKKDG